MSPPVTSLAAALLTALVAEPASRPVDKQDLGCLECVEYLGCLKCEY